MKLLLQRIYSGDDCTLGILYNNKMQKLCLTLEEPWKNNQRQISCVPVGKYKCVPHDGTRFKSVWRLLNVPNRDAVLIHSGNTTNDIEGCILVGNTFGNIDGKKAVLSSVNALQQLRQLIGKQEFELEIVNL